MKKTTPRMLLILAFTGMLALAFNTQRTESLGPPETEWTRTYGGANTDYGWSVVQTDDGGYAIAGWTDSFGAGEEDFWLIKTNSTGNMQWNQTYGDTVWERAYCVIQTSDGGYAIAGETRPSASTYSNRDFWLVKTYANGTMQWNQTYGGTNQEEAYSVIQTSDGGYALAGFTESHGAGGRDFWLIKLAPEPIPAMVDIDPNTLNLKSNGQWITAYVALPEDYSVEDVDVTTVNVTHNDFVLTADWGEVQDGVLMVKFDRAALRDYIGVVDVDDGDKFFDITLTVIGNVVGTTFEGSDTITVKRK